jgi:hypothetical protein
MKQEDSANFAHEVSDFYVKALGVGEHQENQRIHGAVFDQLFEFVPESAVAAVIQRDGDGAPIVAAFHAAQLYLLEVIRDENDHRQPATECRMVDVQPGVGSVSVRTRYLQRGDRRPPRSTTWRFEFVDGLTLTIETYFDPDSDVEPREALGRALAAALGWHMDLPDQGHVAEAA